MERTVRSWLGVPVGSPAVVPRLPPALRRLWLRIEELENPHRNRWSQWEHTFAENYQGGRLWVPEVTEWVEETRAQLRAQGSTLEAPWPEGRSFALCLTHDVDLVDIGQTFRQTLRRAYLHAYAEDAPARRLVRARRVVRELLDGARSRGPRHSMSPIERALEIERSFGAVSSFFFTVYPVERASVYDCVYTADDACRFRGRTASVADVMQTLVAEGFDVGLHGGCLSAVDGRVFGLQKAALERRVGRPITTTRQHWLNWDARRTPPIQAENGIRADTTVGYNRNVGFRSGSALPYHLFDWTNRRELPVIEAPLVIQDSAVFEPDGLDYDLVLAQRVSRQIVDRVAACLGCATVSFHPDRLLDERVATLYRSILQHAVERNAWITSLERLDAWWRQRDVRLGLG